MMQKLLSTQALWAAEAQPNPRRVLRESRKQIYVDFNFMAGKQQRP
jgi:hypothetical protein